MSRVINPDSAGKQRTQLTKSVALAVRELARLPRIDEDARDLAAFIAMALQAISEGVEVSVAAWEKRGYWVKADRFRMDWLWAGQVSQKMRSALLAEDWSDVAALASQIVQKLGKIQVSERHRLGRPWAGAYKKFMEQRSSS